MKGSIFAGITVGNEFLRVVKRPVYSNIFYWFKKLKGCCLNNRWLCPRTPKVYRFCCPKDG